jgi:aldehyde:ferredoxin oxidoreductase
MSSRVLYIDLGNYDYWVKERGDLFREYLGGVGVGIKLLQEECPKDSSPLGKENAIIFAVGPLTAKFPLASKTVALFKSPLTNNLGESHAGGRSATAIASAGYGAIVIKGRSMAPVYLVIDEEGVRFRDASSLWGMRSTYTVGRLIREKERGRGIRTIMRIGRAGERLVSYASVITETYRHFGRLGLGAVFGSKKLKAIQISGKRSIKINRKFNRVYREIYELAVASPKMKKYHDLGTAANVMPLNELGALPTKNLQASSFDKAEEISGEALEKKFLGRRLACSHCPTGCIHLAAIRIPYEKEPYFYKTTYISYDYEPIFSLGSMLGISHPGGMLKLMEEIEILGLDAMSTGVTLAWATEALDKGIVSEKEAMVKLKFGSWESCIKAARLIVQQPNEFYKALAKGCDYTSRKFGGREFALTFAGNEMAGYHTGPASYVNFLTGARHSHLDSGGYGFDQKAGDASPEKIASSLFREEAWRQILSSLVVCFFAREIYTAKIVLKALDSLGIRDKNLKKLGEEILREKYRFKFREGFSFEKLAIPRRVFETPSPREIREDAIEEAVQHYKKLLTKNI